MIPLQFCYSSELNTLAKDFVSFKALSPVNNHEHQTLWRQSYRVTKPVQGYGVNTMLLLFRLHTTAVFQNLNLPTKTVCVESYIRRKLFLNLTNKNMTRRFYKTVLYF